MLTTQTYSAVSFLLEDVLAKLDILAKVDVMHNLKSRSMYDYRSEGDVYVMFNALFVKVHFETDCLRRIV